MRILLHRSIAVLLVLAFATPAAALCGSASGAGRAMAGMSCCTKQAPPAGSVKGDCCRVNERLPESIPPAPPPPSAGLTLDPTPAALHAVPALPVRPDIHTHHALQSARGRPIAPDFLRTSVLLI